jgi:DNA polymerase-3 subunit alpha
MKSFPSLHNHTQFSLLDGVPSSVDYFKRCDELEMEAFAFTDHGNLSSLAEATVESENFKVKPIMGLEGYIIPSIKNMNAARDASVGKEAIKQHSDPYHIILLAKNEAGYKNIITLNNLAWTEGFYYRPKFDYPALFKHTEGVICTSACMAGIVPKLILEGKHKMAMKVASRMKKEFGSDFYLELQLIHMDEQDVVNKALIQLGQKLDIPFVVSNDVHFVSEGDNELQKVLMEIASKGSFSYDAPENYLKTLKQWEDIRNARKSIPKNILFKAIDNCLLVADQCNFRVPVGNLYFPIFDHTTHFMYDKFKTPNKELFFKKMLVARAKKMLGKLFKKDVYRKRLEYEFFTLKKLGAMDYFLICDDLLGYVRSQGAFSLIRGSANGSLIAFVFGFGLIDPIKHGIMFERFISKYRSLNDVDIDIDVRSEFRPKAIKYLRDKYGSDRVVSVGTYNRMQLKGAVKDVTRVLKDRIVANMEDASPEEQKDLMKQQQAFQFSTINRITSQMEGDLNMKKARNLYQVFDEWCSKNQEVSDNFIEPLIGTVRNASLHPAGVVITPSKVDDLLPIRTQVNPANKNERVISTVWENSHTSREDLNEIGVMVLDILAVKTLSVVSEVLSLVKKLRGETIDVYKLKLDDKKTLEMFNNDELIGVFQFSGGSAKRVVEMVPITEFNDLIVINAIARPGALSANADVEYAERKKKKKVVTYAHHSLKPILSDSLGIIVFSEHILRTASEFAGMHPKKADNLRKIIKGKNPAAFKEYKKIFIAGAKKKWKGEKNINKVASNIWKKFSQAGSYLFPRGHASSYALLGYICQYLKVHYPIEFFACHLRYQPQAKYAEVKRVAEQFYGIKFKMPNINTPHPHFEPHRDAIEWPITAIKHVGGKAATTVIENAPYTSIKDFYDRVNKRACNSRVVETLIIAGAFKDFGKKKDVLIEYRSLKGKAEMKKEFPTAFFSRESMIMAMDELYGFSTISIEKVYKKKLKKFGKFTSFKLFNKLPAGKRVKTYGKVVRCSVITTKKGDKMAFLNLQNSEGEYKVTLFPEAFALVGDRARENNVLVVSGKKNLYNNEGSISLSTTKGAKKNPSLEAGSWIKEL